MSIKYNQDNIYCSILIIMCVHNFSTNNNIVNYYCLKKKSKLK